MKRPRFTIAGLAGVVAYCGLIFAGLRSPTGFWGGCIVLSTLVILLSATLGASRGPEPSRTYWMGFALFGWAYAALTVGPFSERSNEPLMPTTGLLIAIHPHIYPSEDPFELSSYKPMWSEHKTYFVHIGNSLATLLFGSLGGLVALKVASRNEPAVPLKDRPEV